MINERNALQTESSIWLGSMEDMNLLALLMLCNQESFFEIKKRKTENPISEMESPRSAHLLFLYLSATEV